MPRTTLMDLRHYDAQDLDLDVTCPAGERVGERLEGPGCRCRIEGETITAARDGSSLRIYCMGEHTFCPTWRLAREAEWEHAAVMKLTAPTGLRRNYDLEDLRQIEEREQAGDMEGAQAIRARIDASRREQGLRDLSRG